jgi:hypothetical protein
MPKDWGMENFWNVSPRSGGNFFGHLFGSQPGACSTKAKQKQKWAENEIKLKLRSTNAQKRKDLCKSSRFFNVLASG